MEAKFLAITAHLQEFYFPLGILFGSAIAGIIFEKVIFRAIAKLADKTKWDGDNIILKSVRGLTVWIFILVGLFFAVASISAIPPAAEKLTKTILILAAIAMATIVTSRIAVSSIKNYTRRAQPQLPESSIIISITTIVIFIIGGLVALQTLGIAIAPILTALGVGGLAVALALRDSLENLFAGLQIILARQIRIGDYVKIQEGQEGYIKDISWRNSTMQMLSGNLVIIPNARLSGTIVTDFSKPEQATDVLVEISIKNSNDLEKAERIMQNTAAEVMEKTGNDSAEFEPMVRFDKFAAGTVGCIVIMRADSYRKQYRLKHEFIKLLQSRFLKEGIGLA